MAYIKKTNTSKTVKKVEKPQREFAPGVNVKVIKTKIGEIVKVGIDIEKFTEGNEINENGYINFDIFTTKDGEKKYAVKNEFKPEEQE